MDREERMVPGARSLRPGIAAGANRPGASDRAREAATSPALDKLAELVRQAEAKTRARKIEGETQHAAEQFREAELRARVARTTRSPADPRRAVGPESIARSRSVLVVGSRRRVAQCTPPPVPASLIRMTMATV
jgi:hypothetical protein